MLSTTTSAPPTVVSPARHPSTARLSVMLIAASSGRCDGSIGDTARDRSPGRQASVLAQQRHIQARAGTARASSEADGPGRSEVGVEISIRRDCAFDAAHRLDWHSGKCWRRRDQVIGTELRPLRTVK
jgi:hypothetical protein